MICAEYLGHLFTGDGDCSEDVNSRMQKARRRFNKMKWLWQDSDLGQELKMKIFVRGVLSILVYGSEAWRLTPKILAKLNGWNSRCMAIITGNTPRAEARIKTQTMDLGGIIRYRRKVWLGHILRSDPGDLGRQDVLTTAELERRDEMDGDGSILMDAPSSSNSQLIRRAGGSGSVAEREEARKNWKQSCFALLSDADRERMGKTNNRYVPVKANTKEETAAELAAKPHRWRIYTDGGCTDSGKGKESGAAGWGCYIEECVDGTWVHVATLWGPVVTDHESRWFMGSPRGTNQTGELNGIGQGLMWLNNVPVDDGDAAIIFDSMYAANQTQGKWKPKANKEAIKLNEELLATTSSRRTVHFVHVKGHSGNEGNDHADELVQWGKDEGPYSRFRKGGGEGPGRYGPAEKDGEELGGAAAAGGDNPTVEGAADEGAGGSPERASGGGADVPASPASDALEEAWNAQRREDVAADLAELEAEEQRQAMPPPPPRLSRREKALAAAKDRQLMPPPPPRL